MKRRTAPLLLSLLGLSIGTFAACSPAASSPEAQGAGGTGNAGAGGAFGSGGSLFLGDGGNTQFSNGGSDTGSGGGGGDCGSTNYQSTLTPSSILFVVDRSGSMNCNLTTDVATCEASPTTVDATQPTRWSSIVDGIGAALDELAKVPNTSVGLTFFSNDDVCGVTSTPNVELGDLNQTQVDALKNALKNGNPRGGTPIVGATILAFKHLHQQAMAPGNRFVVLVTDGQDSCIATNQDGGAGHTTYADEGITGDVIDRLLNTEMPKAATVNIRTFVIGAPGSEPARGLLSKIASKGDTAKSPTCDATSDNPDPGAECHFDMTRTTNFAADLSAALQQVTGQAISCEFDVPIAADGTRVDPTKLNVDYYQGGTTLVPFYKDDACASPTDGWKYTDTTQTKVVLCDGACSTIRSDLKASIQVALSCQKQRAR